MAKKRPGRPRGPKTQKFTLRINHKQYKEVRRLSRVYGVPMNEIVTRFIDGQIIRGLQ